MLVIFRDPCSSQNLTVYGHIHDHAVRNDATHLTLEHPGWLLYREYADVWAEYLDGAASRLRRAASRNIIKRYFRRTHENYCCVR